MIAHNNSTLARLSNTELLQRLDVLVTKERQITLKLILHLNEVERRCLYLGRGYGSLFEYCTRHLGYSESAAIRRIKTARCIQDFPEVYEMLAKNELNLTTVSKIAPILTAENKNELLQEARMKSSRYVENLVARKNPKHKIRDRVRTVYLRTSVSELVKASVSQTDDGLASDSVASSASKPSLHLANRSVGNLAKFTSGAGGKLFTTVSEHREQKQVLEKRYKLEFAVNPEVMSKIEQVKAMLSTKFPKGIEFEQLFDILLNEYLDRHSPERKIKRREKRAANKKQSRTKSIATRKKSQQFEEPFDKTCTRHIPAAVKDAVYTRDQGRCAFISPDGVKCKSTWNLQIDHIVPFAKGGQHSVGNLRLLCARHNKLEAERIYGPDFITKKINNSRPLRE